MNALRKPARTFSERSERPESCLSTPRCGAAASEIFRTRVGNDSPELRYCVREHCWGPQRLRGVFHTSRYAWCGVGTPRSEHAN